MNLFIKTLLSFAVLALGLWVINLFRMSGAESLMASALAVKDLNGGTPAFIAKEMFQRAEYLYMVKVGWILIWVIGTTWVIAAHFRNPGAPQAKMKARCSCGSCSSLMALLALFPFLPSCEQSAGNALCASPPVTRPG
jgi:hypothetical protein